MPNNDVNEQKRKIYQKPELTIIDLAAEEVLAGGCKTPTTMAAPGNPFCVLTGGCAGIGS
jgi:hypothetical protein